MCGFYANELLVKFCAREDPQPPLFNHYVLTLTRLAHGEPAVQVLRSFERVLLRETGYAMALNRTVARRAVGSDRRYVFDPERGVRNADDEVPSHWPVISGQTLLDMEQDDYHRAPDGCAKQDADALPAEHLSRRYAACHASDPDRPAKPMSFFLTTPTAIDLGVNIDHVATLRNVRGTTYPDPIRAALAAEEAGADAITLHLREDRRHIVDADVRKLRPLLKTRMNLECAVTVEMLDIACEVRPHDACLVPEKREELTTEGGLDVAGHFEAVRAACKQLADVGVRVSLFIDPDETQIRAAHEAGAPVIELHTGRYAEAHDEAEQQREYERIVAGVQAARSSA